MQQPITKNFFRDIKQSRYFQMLPSMQENNTQKITTLVLTLFALAFFGLFAINPTISTIAKLQKELEDNKFVEEQLKTKIQNLSTLQEKYAMIQTDLPHIFEAIPKKPDVAKLTGQVHALAKEKDLRIDSFQIFSVQADKNNASQDYTSFIFAVNGEGDFPAIKSFLSSLISIQRIISLDSMLMTKTNEHLQLNLRGVAFYKK